MDWSQYLTLGCFYNVVSTPPLSIHSLDIFLDSTKNHLLLLRLLPNNGFERLPSMNFLIQCAGKGYTGRFSFYFFAQACIVKSTQKDHSSLFKVWKSQSIAARKLILERIILANAYLKKISHCKFLVHSYSKKWGECETSQGNYREKKKMRQIIRCLHWHF